EAHLVVGAGGEKGLPPDEERIAEATLGVGGEDLWRGVEDHLARRGERRRVHASPRARARARATRSRRSSADGRPVPKRGPAKLNAEAPAVRYAGISSMGKPPAASIRMSDSGPRMVLRYTGPPIGGSGKIFTRSAPLSAAVHTSVGVSAPM